MALPDTIRIGAIDYRITVVEELASDAGGLYGDICYSKCRIRISADDSPQLQVVTLWHELLHGILFHAGIPGDEHDEATIRALAAGLVAALRDNPTLAQGATSQPKEA